MINTNIIQNENELILFVNCPHCNDEIIIFKTEINCGIFRHAIFKNNYEQINPHASKEECENYLANNIVYGCAKPFRIIGNIAEICDYI
jgi:hypothetical protein